MPLDGSATESVAAIRSPPARSSRSLVLAARLRDAVGRSFARVDAWKVLNSPVIILLLSVLALGGMGAMIASYVQSRAIENERRGEIAALCQELEARSTFLLNIAELSSDLGDRSYSVPFIDLRPFAYGEVDGTYVDPKYKGFGILGIYNRIEYLSHIESNRNDDLVNGLTGAQIGRFLPAHGAVLLALDTLRLVDLRKSELSNKKIPLPGNVMNDAYLADHFKDADLDITHMTLRTSWVQDLLGKKVTVLSNSAFEDAFYESYHVRVRYLPNSEVGRYRQLYSNVAKASAGSLGSKYDSF